MSFQEFVNTGFGLWTPDYVHGNGVKKQRPDYDFVLSQENDSVETEERESKQRRHQKVDGDRDIEQMTVSLIDNRNDLIKNLKELEAENNKLKAELFSFKARVAADNERMKADNEKLKADNVELIADNEKWKSHAGRLITDTRRSLEEIRRQTGDIVRLQKEITELKSENENLRNENAYRHIIMRQMKKRSSYEPKREKSVFEMINPCG